MSRQGDFKLTTIQVLLISRCSPLCVSGQLPSLGKLKEKRRMVGEVLRWVWRTKQKGIVAGCRWLMAYSNQSVLAA